ncbi:MAG: cell division protein FtsW [Bacteroidetes bacterium 4484_276]|nr:MAG: cell division protein FtsW [Bacteroidetes bacterium 4484_276]
MIEKIKGDKVIWTIAILLSVLSLLVVYSSTGSLAYRMQGGNTEYYLFKQFIIVVLGFGLMYVAHLIHYKYFSRLAQFLFFLSIPLLLITMFFGPEINSANRLLWIPGTGLTFQPSDLAKLALLMYIARFLAKNQDQIKNFKSGFLLIIVPIIIICALILPGNFSTAAIIFVTSLILLFIGRANFYHILSLVGIGIISIGILYFIGQNITEEQKENKLLKRTTTWVSRIDQFFNPDEDQVYQVEQSKIAVATGGVIGKMPGNSIQRNFLPHPYSDFVYAIIIEEYGIIGGFAVMLLYLILMFRSMKIARRCPMKFGSFLVIGISFMMVFQALINMGVAVNILPVTGQTLPFISMGGTSFWFTSIGIGMILSVSRNLGTQQIETKNLQYATA